MAVPRAQGNLPAKCHQMLSLPHSESAQKATSCWDSWLMTVSPSGWDTRVIFTPVHESGAQPLLTAALRTDSFCLSNPNCVLLVT